MTGLHGLGHVAESPAARMCREAPVVAAHDEHPLAGSQGSAGLDERAALAFAWALAGCC